MPITVLSPLARSASPAPVPPRLGPAPSRYVPRLRLPAPLEAGLPRPRVVPGSPAPAPALARPVAPVVVLRLPPEAAPPRPEMRVVSFTPLVPPASAVTYEPATKVGILGSASTIVSMQPADLMNGYRSDITEFSVILDAGIY